MDKIEHIGIAVRNIDRASSVYTKLLGVESYKREAIAAESVITAFFQVGNQKIELLQASSPDSVIAKFIDRRGEGLHHIAFQVTDIYAEMKRLKTEGFTLLNEVPKPGADNKLVCFIHPKEVGGVLIELCQDISPGKEMSL